MPRPTYTFPYYEADETDTNPSQQYSWLDTVTTRRLPTSWPPPGHISDEQLTINQLNKENAPLEWFPAIQEGIRNVRKLVNREKLPVEPIDENMPKWQRDLNAAFELSLKQNPLTAGLAALTTDPRTGVRYKTWPEQMIRNAVAGAPASFDPITGHTSEATIARAQDIAGMMGGGSVASVGPEASLASSGMMNKPRKYVNNLQLDNLLNRSKEKELRGIIDNDTGNIHFWDASNLTHSDAAKELGLNYDIDNRIHLRKSTDEPGYSILDFDDKWAKRENIANNPNFRKLLNRDDILVNNYGQGLITGKEFLALSDTSTAAPISALAKSPAPRFYSALENAVKNASEKMTANKWWDYITDYEKHQVKPEEIDWVGLENILGPKTTAKADFPAQDKLMAWRKDNKGKPPQELIDAASKERQAAIENRLKSKDESPEITRAELERFVQEHKVELKEVVNADLEQEISANRKALSDLTVKYLEARRENNTAEMQRLEKERDTLGWEWQRLTNMGQTKHSQWQLPGGENYREIIKTLPTNSAQAAEIAALKARHSANRSEVKDLIDSHGPNGNGYVNNIEKITKLNEEANSINQRLVELEKGFTHSHWPRIVNPVYHMRINDRVIPGFGKSKHVEEFQSDMHQEGRRVGYVGELENLQPEFVKINKKLMDNLDEKVLGDPDMNVPLNDAIDKGLITKKEAEIYKRYSKIEAAQTAGAKPVPDAPFKQTWSDRGLKDIIRLAAEEGADVISWTPGEAQAARYDLSKQISKLEYDPESGRLFAYDHENKQVMNEGVEPTVRALEEHIGKEPAEKLVKEIENHAERKEYERGEWSVEQNEETGRWEIYDPNGELHHDYGGESKSFKTEKGANNYIDELLKEDAEREGTHNPNISGLDLKVGAEPMKAFYDKMLVDKANAIAKKFGGKVEQSGLQDVSSFYPVTDGKGKWRIFDPKTEDYAVGQNLTHGRSYASKAEAEKAIKEFQDNNNVHVLRITPQLRDAALNRGFSLFADTGKVGAPLAALTRVEHNPFKLAELEKQHGVKLTPVAENPFTTDAYHGHRGSFRGQEIEPSSKDRGVEFYSVLRDPKLANVFAERQYAQNPTTKEGSGILPLKLNTKDYHTFDAKGKYWQEINDQAIFEANQLGKKGVIVKNVVETRNGPMANKQSDIAITLDPSTVRGKFAKFDPAKFGESGLLKSGGLPIYSDENGNQLLPPPRNPAQVDLPPWAQALGFKAGEYAVWLANRGNPNINGPMWAMTAAQWPLISRNIKNEIARQRAQGKDINQIIQDIPMLHDVMNLGKPPPKITPVEGNPFGTAR